MTDRRLLLVHAHPDDESIGTGATMAKYAAEGAQVTLVTCTLGEEGEVIPPELTYLNAAHDDTLGQHRIGELAAACAALGVADHRFLGGAGRWRDSGMMGAPTNDNPACFWQADLDEAAAALVEVIKDVRPQVIVTYDENGFYGHPDHIQANRAAWQAFQQVKGTPLEVAKFYHTAAATAEGITTTIDARPYLPAKAAALRAHATQVTVDEPWFALFDGARHRLSGVEYYILAGGAAEQESDLFTGIFTSID